MPIRIEIELTSASEDGSWTWRAAGAREPRGVLDGSILPEGASVGDQFRVETEQDLDGIHVLAVLPPKEKSSRTGLLELLPTEERFEPVVQHRAPGGREADRGRRGPRRERGERGERRDRRDGPDRRRDGAPAERARGERGDRPHERGDRGERPERREPRRSRPHFTPPPEVPQRPKPKRLRPGKAHRTAVLESLPEEQRPVAELALQGLAAVRQRLREDNARLRTEGKPEMPEAAVMKMAEDLLPRLRVADWLDRAEAAKRQLDHLDLRDLRSVVAASEDPLVARDESTRALAVELKESLLAKQEEELALWLSDVEAALDVGRVVRALRLSSQPPKAGVPFPPALAHRLGEATTAALSPSDAPERWIAVLEAAAFSPVRTHVTPASQPEQVNDDLRATVKRLGPLLPQVAAIFGIEVPADAHIPKPLRPTPRKQAAKGGAGAGAGGGGAAKPTPKPTPPPAAEAKTEQAAEPKVEDTAEPTASEAAPAAEQPTAEAPTDTDSPSQPETPTETESASDTDAPSEAETPSESESASDGESEAAAEAAETAETAEAVDEGSEGNPAT